MVNYDSFMVTLSAALGASVLVERVLEFLKNVSEPLIGSKHRRVIPRSKDDGQKITELERALEAGKQENEWDERYPLNTVLVEPASDPDDGTVLRTFVIQLTGFALGILAAHLFGVRLFKVLAGGARSIAPWVDYLLTGLLIGGGSAPIHMLIRFVTRGKVASTAENGMDSSEEKEVQPLPAPVERPVTTAEPTKSAELDIPYYGGVDRDKLEWRHLRKEDPSMIVYHHTAMHHESTFGDVVRVIRDRGWVTGYNCVIMADGAIKPFCRWDRFGGHAKGYNMKSLGLAFNGNFETNPGVPYSNPDRRFGPSRPSEAQLKAGARVTALWNFLYDIAPDFENTVVPHNKIAAKACPGSNFPYDEFRRWVEYYRNRWEKSPEMMERIGAFKMKPYLYVSKTEK